MTVKEDQTDGYGRSGIIVFSGAKSVDEVYQWLHKHYQGYKFGMVFDCMPEELRAPDRNYYVYFLDELADEVMSYCDFYKKDKDTYKSKYAKER